MNTICGRLSAFRARMAQDNLAAVIVPTADSHASEYIPDAFMTRKWLCGFTGSAGTLVVGRDEAALFTDGRYFIQAERQLAGSGVALMRMGTPGCPSVAEYAARLAGENGLVGMDFGVVASDFPEGVQKALAGESRAVDCGDLFADVWTDRPAMPDGAAWNLDEAYAGRSAQEKLADIRAAMAKAGAGVHVCNVLDDIAWTLNVRGSDVHCTPVVLSFLLVTESEAVWFVDERKITGEVARAMDAAEVEIRGYDDIFGALRSLPAKTRVLGDPGKLTAKLCEAIRTAGAEIIGQKNPAFLMKGVKNETELANLRAAHIRDGAAVAKLMYWLKTRAGKEPMTEISVSERLTQLRAQQEGFIEPSFNTICAYRANAAMMHYSATPETDAVIEPRDLLLIDSGGQYFEGTTDITRTFAMGEVTQEQKEHFTAVLCSVINLASAKFLAGCTGVNLDILARGPIWDLGIDYRCGTGHGVGYLLSVHEGPNGFRWYRHPTRSEDTPLEPGMVTTDEPGIYIEGSHGIRTENELVCRRAEENEYGQFLCFETITCAPIDLDAVIPENMTAKQKKWLNDYHAFVYEKLAEYMTDEERAWLRTATRAIG